MAGLWLVTITDPLQPRQRKPAVTRFVVLATSEAAVIPTLRLHREAYLTPHGQIDVEPWDVPVVRLGC